MEERRPDPDLLIDRIRRETERSHEGQLKIFFGAAPGVGKTYAMLGAAQQKRTEGIDVVVGLVETHGRKETEALLAGLEMIPRLPIEYRSATLAEFDIDAALKRKPDLIVVTNSPTQMLPTLVIKSDGRTYTNFSAPGFPYIPQ